MSRGRRLSHLFVSDGPALRRFLRRFAARDGAEDLVQESFARLCAVEDQAIASPRAYLFQTARNIAINEARRQKRSPTRLVANPASLDIESPEPSPEDQVIAAEALAQLQAALADLPERQRQALILFKVEGLSHREIGQRLGVSHRTVERYVADALAHCHAALRAREE